jgi:hypothetical protein
VIAPSHTLVNQFILAIQRLNLFYNIYKNPVRISQEGHYFSTTEPSRLMLYGYKVAVYCENYTEHTDTLCGQNAVRTSQETQYVSATEPNRLMLFVERVIIYCENHTEHTDTLFGQNA